MSGFTNKPFAEDPRASIGWINPHARLAGAVVIRALQDLRGDDPLNALDAWIWLVLGDGPIFLEAIQFSVDETDILQLIANGGVKNDHKPTAAGFTLSGNRKHEHDRTAAISR